MYRDKKIICVRADVNLVMITTDVKIASLLLFDSVLALIEKNF